MASQPQQQEESTSTQTIVDRTVTPFLPQPDTTPSHEKDGISFRTERLYRLYGTSLLQSASSLLRLSASTYATSCSIFHRFYHSESLKKYDVWSVAMACTLLSGKIEEEPRQLHHIIVIYNHLHRRRLLCVDEEDTNFIREQQQQQQNIHCSQHATTLLHHERQNILRHIPSMSPLGPIYKEWNKALLDTENVILRQMGFTLYWIPDSHPHRFILYFVRVLEIQQQQQQQQTPKQDGTKTTTTTATTTAIANNNGDDETNNAAAVTAGDDDNANIPNDFAQRAWNYCNDAYRLDLCVRYGAEVIACAAIHLAVIDLKLPMLPQTPHPWWEVFVGQSKESDISNVCNAIIGLSDLKQTDVRIASRFFISSLVEGGCFNDPDSYLFSVNS